jgi:hypothetical protein
MDAVEEIAFIDAQRPAMMCGTLFSVSCGSRHVSPPLNRFQEGNEENLEWVKIFSGGKELFKKNFCGGGNVEGSEHFQSQSVS